MLIDDHEFWETRFYQEWCKPQRYLDNINFKILQTEHRIGWWAAHRLEGQPRYGTGDIELVNLLVPHVCRAIRISDALNLKTIRSEVLEATLNALTSGVYLVDLLGRVIYLNRAAEQQVGKGDVVRIEKARLAPVDRMARLALMTAINETIADEVTTPQVVLRLPFRAARGRVWSPPYFRSVVGIARTSVVHLPQRQQSSCKTRLSCLPFQARPLQSSMH